MIKKITVLLIIIFLLSPVFSASDSDNTKEDGTSWWDSDWSFREEINIPIDTGEDNAKFQPIDIKVEFNDPCWAMDEKVHSIRVIYQNEEEIKELECQIYDLNHSEDNYIDTCNLVFLIPEQADGQENYYIYYDDEEKNSPVYEDHVDIKESYYYYSPFYGLTTESWSYDITQEGFIEYAVIKRGEASNGFLSQRVVKFKKEAKENNQKNYKHVSSFGAHYWWLDGGSWHVFSTTEKLLSKDILIDGNLMVKCAVVSISKNNKIKTTGIYTYYYCPTEDKRIFPHIKHEVIGYPLPTGEKVDISLGDINCGSIDSSYEELNYGKIPPYLHFYNEEGRIVSFDLDTNPEYNYWKYLIKEQDDEDLGDPPWISADYGEKGTAQALILDSDNIVKSGENEPDGIQLQLIESNSIDLPNLDVKRAQIFMNRNSYEAGERDTIVPRDYIAEYKAEFFSTEKGGYKKVEKEAAIYHKLVDFKPESKDDIDDNETEEYNKSLTVYAHLKGLLLSKVYSSLLLFKNTHICAELYHENDLLQIKRMNKIPINDDFSIDWKNISLFRKATFDNLKEGKYLVKVIVKNLFSENNDRFVGFKTINLKDNMKTHIFCKFEGTHDFFVHDQKGEGIKDAKIQFLYDNFTVFEGFTDSNGGLKVGLPCGMGTSYDKIILYKGFLIREENVNFGLIRSLIPLYKNISVEVYPLSVEINGKTKKESEVDLSITSSNMYNKQILTPDKFVGNSFTFSDIPKNDYLLELGYNQFKLKKALSINDETTVQFQLNELSVDIFDRWNLTPDASFDLFLTSDDFENEVVLSADEIQDNNYVFKDLFSGNYTLELFYKSEVIKRNISVPYDKNRLSLDFPILYNLNTKFYDSHGHLIKNINMEISRDDESRTIHSNKKGEVIISLPPGTYSAKIFSNDQLISKRNISVISDISLKIVTKNEPVYPLFISVFIVFGLLLAGIYCIRKRKITLLLKTIVVSLVLLSIVFPWWSLSGDNPQNSIETTSNLFLHNPDIITVTTYEDMVYGNFGLLGEDFNFAVNIVILTIAIGLSILLGNIILKRLYYNNLASLMLVLSFLGFIGSIIISYIAMSTFAEVIVGDFVGSGKLNISLPGSNISSLVFCNWGPGIGFYLFLISIIVMGVLIVLKVKHIFIKSITNKK